jgi:hypothetical protein
MDMKRPASDYCENIDLELALESHASSKGAAGES